MLRLYDFPWNRVNGYKSGLLLTQLGLPVSSASSSTFTQGADPNAGVLAKNPNAAFRCSKLPDGPVSPKFERHQSFHLAEGSRFLPGRDRFERALVLKLDGSLEQLQPRSPTCATVARLANPLHPARRRAAAQGLPRHGPKAGYAAPRKNMGRHISRTARTLVGDRYSIADIALYATPTSPMRAASTSAATRRSAPGWTASPPEPGHIPDHPGDKSGP